ncbi:MAG: PAS domain S-box protein [bacterium]|nr:PAS domain S-box protein [bacterium]
MTNKNRTRSVASSKNTSDGDAKENSHKHRHALKTDFASLQAELQGLYGVLMQAPAMIALCRGPKLVFEFANPLYLQVVGKTDKILGKTVLEVFPELRGQKILKILMDVYKTGKPYIGKEVLINLDVNNVGKPEDKYFNFVYHPYRNENGKVVGILTHAIEVSEQVKARKKAEENEERYKLLFNSITQGFCVIELQFDKNNKPVDYEFIEVNKLFKELTGLKNPVGKKARKLVPNLEEHWFEIYGKVALTGKSVHFTESSEAMGRWYDVHASRVGGKESRKVALLFTDITDKKKAETSKLSAANQMTEVLESMGDAFFVLDKDWKIILVNRHQEKISQTKRKDTLGKSFWDVFPATAEADSNYWVKYHQVMKTRKPVHFIEHYRPLDIYTEVDAYPTSEGGISVFFRDITLTKKSQDALKTSEERFRTLIEQSTDAIQLVTPEGAILYTSDSIKNVLGYTAKELEGSGVNPYLHPDDIAYFYERLAELIKIPKKRITLEYRVKHKDGTWAWLETTGVNHLNTPNINALVGTFRNVTKRKKALEQTEYQNSLLEAQQEVLPLGIVVISETGKIVVHNKRFAKMWQFPAHIIKSSLDDLALKAAQEQLINPKEFMDRVSYLYKNRKASNEQLFFKDGRVFDRYGSPIFGSNGTYFGYVWYFLDITKEKQALKDLEDSKYVAEASEAQLRFMAESMPQKLFTATPDGDVDYFNPQWMEYTGLTFDQIKDWGWLQFIHPDDIDKNVKKWRHSIETGEPFELEHRFRNKYGKYHWHFSRAKAMRDEKGNIIKWIGTNTDTEVLRKAIYRQEQLEFQTASLQEQRKQLIMLNEAKDDFISLASHQLRTPATGVKQYLGIVLEGMAGKISKEQQAFISEAYDSNERQITIINDLLKVAQIDAGKVTLYKRKLDLVSLVETVIKEQALKFKEKNQKITVHHSKPTHYALADKDRMRMVIENLIDNANKYTQDGKSIEVSIREVKDSIKIIIKDQGIGIPNADASKLFKKFSRLSNTSALKVGGTGLGLYWAKKIVDLHKGSIVVDSVEGQGTTFTIILNRI